MRLEIIDGQKTIFAGEKNDAITYATSEFTPLAKEDLMFQEPEFIIRYDSGVYPGTTDVDAYMCNKARRWFYE